MTNPIHRRPATEDDKIFLKRLAREVYQDVVTKQFGCWDETLQDKHFQEKWSRHNYQIIEQAGQKIGAFWISREPDHLWLSEIQIAPSHQNQGIGTVLLKEALREARALGLPLRLHVLIENRAKALYERLGFNVIGMLENTHYQMEHKG